jgi:alkylation response protein AidB-like acyl-CoA dehydrogenase
MPVETAREIWSEDRAVATNGPPTRGTIAVPVEGGYNLSGRWNFSSGSNIATWIAARTPVKRSSDGTGHPGSAARMLLMPKSQVSMIDEWQVNGLRGTASFSFEVSDLFVPESHSYDEADSAYEKGPLYAIPKIPLFALGFASIATVLARTCLDDAIELVGRKAPVGSKTLLRDESTTQRTLGESEAMLRSASAYLHQAGGEMWREVCEVGALSMDRRMEVRMATTHAIREAEKVVHVAYDLFGSDAIFTSNAIQQRFQDMSVITQHIQSRRANFETAGKYFLGLDPGTIL